MANREVNDRTCIRKEANVTLLETLHKDAYGNERLVALAAYMSAVGNETRLRMLYVLWRAGELCVCDLADIFEITQPAVSRHLRILREKALVEARRDGQTIFYRVCHETPFARMLLKLFSEDEEARISLGFLDDGE
ncbi:MAG: metalloregulator ArsR/SmtB family transcription factor [Rhodothermia bacterium]|nr:metalloregulator ArsR/SmtB family transcription factor [Rhodothermia bacterium]